LNGEFVRVVQSTFAITDLDTQRGPSGLVDVPSKRAVSLRTEVLDYGATGLATWNQTDVNRWGTSCPGDGNGKTGLRRARGVDSERCLGRGKGDEGSQGDEDLERHGFLEASLMRGDKVNDAFRSSAVN